jgi:hypothetical protein
VNESCTLLLQLVVTIIFGRAPYVVFLLKHGFDPRYIFGRSLYFLFGAYLYYYLEHSVYGPNGTIRFGNAIFVSVIME